MLVYKLLSIALTFLWSALHVSSYEECSCTKPTVRREWRALSAEEKVEWIRAVNVRIDTRLALVVFLKHIRIQCLSRLPHDSALTPSVDPSVSLIPPINSSSSYYDGMIQSIGFAFWMLGVLTVFCTDIVYMHMDLNTRVL